MLRAVARPKLALTPNALIFKSFHAHLFGIVLVAAVEDNRIAHQAFHGAEIRMAKRFPFSDQGQSVGVFERIVLMFG